MASGIFNALARPVRSVNDYLADYDARDARKQSLQHNALALQQQQATMADQERARAEGMTVRNALAALGPEATLQQRAQTLRGTNLPAGYTQADALEKALRDQQKHDADIGKTGAETAAKALETKRKAFEYGVQGLQVAQTPEQAAELFNQGVQAGHWPMQFAQFHLKSMPADPAGFARWRVQQLAQITDAKDQLPKQVSEDMGGSRLLGTRDPFTGALTVNSSMPKTQTPDNAASNARMAADAAASRAQSDRHFNTRLGSGGGNNAPPKRPAGPMSVTLQKELLESDDTAQASANVIRTIDEALKINDAAYSGYAAKPRAVLRSNLPFESKGADATINLDNMMTGQALESLKLIFGGMPTEGERKILLEMQASADKTPPQRKSILDRARAAAERRGAFAAKKAAAIRDGSYLTDGVPADDPTKPGKTDPETFDELPDASKFSGKRMRADDGTVYRSDGKKWVKE